MNNTLRNRACSGARQPVKGLSIRFSVFAERVRGSCSGMRRVPSPRGLERAPFGPGIDLRAAITENLARVLRGPSFLVSSIRWQAIDHVAKFMQQREDLRTRRISPIRPHL